MKPDTSMFPVTARASSSRSVAVRLEGGLGDHVLGMRVLAAIRERFPDYQIVVYSDSARQAAQIEVTLMCPFVDRVLHVDREPNATTWETMGRLEHLDAASLKAMHESDVFIDACGASMFIPAARLLDVPVFDLLAQRPQLQIPLDALQEAQCLLAPYDGHVFVGVNLAKYGPVVLQRHGSIIRHVLQILLRDPNVIVLHLFTSSYGYAHWPEPLRSARARMSVDENRVIQELFGDNERVVSCQDLPLRTIAALLAHCRYFVGVDNGIKHLAWALNVPRTYFAATQLLPMWVLRWMPDVHRLLPLDCDVSEVERYAADVRSALTGTGLTGVSGRPAQVS